MNAIRALILTILIVLPTGCSPMTPPTTVLPAAKSMRFLALGDSYTIGESVNETERWPVQLAARLGAHGAKVDLSMIARTGWTTNELWQAIQAADPQGSYELVSL